MSVSSMGPGNKKQQLKSDLTLKMDFGLRDNKTVLRRIDEAINQISTGYRQISIKTTADYMINQKLNIRFFFDKTITNPFVSGSQFYTSQTNGGITLRFTLSQ
jgi:cell surface protein SprA